MLTRAAAVLLLAAATAHADSTLVVVTPNAPVIVPTAPGAIPPGAEEEPPAAPAPAALAPTGAPQNEAWSNVSHINGMPVPVGERNQYLYKFRKTNISANPFGLLFGYYDGSAAFAVNQNIALSVSATYYAMDHDVTGYQVVASAPLFFRRTFSGPYLEPGVMLRSSRDRVYYDCSDGCGGTATTPSDDWAGIEMLVGWQWTFDGGLNVAMAFGVARHLASNHDAGSDDNADANGYFRVGYAF
jgi:hypothetical protein